MIAQPLLRQQLQNTSLDLVASLPYRFDPLPFGIGQGPIVSPETGNVIAFIPTTDRDQHLGILSQLCSQFLGLCIAKVNSHLAHCVYNDRMYTLGGMSPSRDAVRQFWIGKLVEEGSRHLRAAGVVNDRRASCCVFTSACGNADERQRD
jgi:hypothetical protein